jgi:Domain of unknown function (DUF4499)
MGADQVERPHGGWWAAILGGLGLNAVVGFVPAAYDLWAQHVTTALSAPTVQAIFLAAAVVHVAEATYAYRLAARSGFEHAASGWFWQTLALGFPSLRLLRAHARVQNR